ncbi:hypothetical protein [Nostoc sp. CCY 9925]|uniref:hypothetical protein n=1 Tax=Nostoc sp. CCY 9925 TaxID=3103865 RepID=UPI0039C6C416
MFFTMSDTFSATANSSGSVVSVSTIDTSVFISTGNVVAVPGLNTCLSSKICNFGFKLEPHFTPDVFRTLFGDNAFQDANKLVIHKDELPGLTPSISNTAESLLVGLINRSIANSGGVNFLKISINYWGRGYTDGLRIDTVLIDMCKLAEYDGSLLLESNYFDVVSPIDY